MSFVQTCEIEPAKATGWDGPRMVAVATGRFRRRSAVRRVRRAERARWRLALPVRRCTAHDLRSTDDATLYRLPRPTLNMIVDKPPGEPEPACCLCSVHQRVALGGRSEGSGSVRRPCFSQARGHHFPTATVRPFRREAERW